MPPLGQPVLSSHDFLEQHIVLRGQHSAHLLSVKNKLGVSDSPALQHILGPQQPDRATGGSAGELRGDAMAMVIRLKRMVRLAFMMSSRWESTDLVNLTCSLECV
jgi:hypothetical protein